MRRTFICVIGLAVCLFASACESPAHAGTAPLKVGIPQSFFHDMSKPLIETVTDPFIAIMKETAGLTGDMVIGGDAFSVAQQVNDNKLQMGLFFGFEFAWVQQKHPELRPLMVAVNAKKPVRVYLLVPKDSVAKSFADLKGKELAVPKRTREHCRYLVERMSGGSKKFFGLVVPPDNVETALDELVQKKHHAVVVDAAGLDFYKDLNPGRFGKLRVLTQSEVFPPLVIAYRPGAVNEETLAKAKRGLAAAHKTEMFREMEKTWNITSIEPVPENFAQTLAASLKTFPMLETKNQEKPPAGSTEVEEALGRAGKNRPELEKALATAPAEQRKGMEFLVANMPDRDLLSLKADFLLENVDLAYKARKQVPWGDKIPEEVFLDNVLAYANVDELRDPWRKELYDLCMPLIKDCKTPSEAAQLLNREVFSRLKVKYSTGRKKPHQSPRESMETGLASCTGLSILLSDACRAVAVPARLAGTPLWTNKSGNHTWVEIWDNGWHFTGACEPDKNGLDRGWFVGNAAQAKKDVPEHAIYAASFRRTGVSFPLVWARGSREVYAENVTERYTRIAGVKPGLTDQERDQIEKQVVEFFSATPEQQSKLVLKTTLDQLLVQHEQAVRQIVWKAYQDAPMHAALKKDFEQKQVRYKEHLSAFKVRDVGKRPANGWPLFIAMHGGGNAPKKLNDSQWEHMQIYYKDQPSVTGYKYLALRAPNDVWNGFYDNYVPPLVTNLIREFTLFGDVDPDKVFLMGYSHGGYGAFFIGPKIPDRFAAVHASAAAPTDGTISPMSLRNTRFSFMIGENDNAYGRRERCEKFDAQIQKLKEANKGDFPIVMEFKKGFAHSGLPDRDKIKEMYDFTRNTMPRHLTWELTDSFITDFFWLSVAKPANGQSIDATIDGKNVQVTTRNVQQCELCLDSRLVAYDQPLQITLDGTKREVTLRPQLLTLCQSMLQRGDPQLAFMCRIVLDIDKTP